jgi:ATP-dependent DNA helicase DinG
MKIPSPADCGLPTGITAWRSGQEEAIDVMITSKKRATAICAPTGFGKSECVVGTALLSKLPTCIVTYSRGLEDQYINRFESIGMVDIRGRSNYKCDLKEDYTCEEGYASRCPYKGTVACPSSQAEMRAATSNLVVTNYDKWIAAKKFGQGMQHFKQVIFDEGHSCPDALSRAMQVTLNHREIEDKLHIDFLTGEEAEDFTYWRVWASRARETCKLEMQAAYNRIQSVSDPKPAWVKHYTHMRNLLRRLAVLSTARANEWVVEQTEQGFQFDPVRPGRYAESTLLLHLPRIIVISATLRPKTMFMIGIGKNDFEFREFDSDFDPKRCPIYYIPTMRVDKRNEHNMVHLWIKLDQIAAKRRDRKGIVQTVSYARQKDVVASSRFWESMIVNEKGEPPAEIIEQFKNAGPGSILVSPSVGTGYDFSDDLARWNFICKIPFDPPSKILKAREADDPEYRGYRAMQTLIQSLGRDVRSKTDWSERFICDEHLSWFLPKFGHLAPRSFHMFMKRVDTVPQPPSLESM